MKNTNAVAENGEIKLQETNVDTEETDLTCFFASVIEDEKALQKQYEQAEKEYSSVQKEFESKKTKKEGLEEKIASLEEKISSRETKKEKYVEELENAKKTINRLAAKYQQAISAEKLGSVQAEKELKENLLSDESALTSYEMQLSVLKNALQEVKDTYKTARHNWRLFKESFQDGVWMAKKSGTLSYVGYEVGSYINSATPVVGYDNTDELSVELTVDQSEISSIAVGDRVSIRGSFRKEVTGTIANISNIQNSQSVSKVTYAVVVTVENSDNSLVSGDKVTVTFETEPVEEALYLSNRLVQRDEQGDYVLLKNENGSTVRTEITTGVSNNMFTEIKEGLNEGDCCVAKSR